MYCETGSDAELRALEEAVRITSSIRQNLSSLNIPLVRYPLPLNAEALIPNLDLSVPQETLAPLSKLNLPDDVRRIIIQRLDEFITDLQQKYTSTYRHTCLETLRSTNDIKSIQNIYKIYHALTQRRFLPKVQSQVSFIVDEVAKRRPPNVCENKCPFNNEFLPVLEKYFEFNGYPSPAHRSILSQKSKMKPRQIEVWFQNHRNRAKKEGKPIPRIESEIPLKRALDILHRNQQRLPTPSENENVMNVRSKLQEYTSITYTKTPSEQQNIQREPTFLEDCYSPRPLHAFPAAKGSQFPDPFPTECGVFKFAPPCWRRKVATAPIVSIAVDMDEFTRLFHLKLNFAESVRQRGIVNVKTEPSSTQPWFTSTTTLASSAPHPALVSSSPTCRSSSTSLRSSSNSLVFMPTFGLSSLAASTSYSSSPGRTSVRKIRPLPHRKPSQAQHNPSESRCSSFGSDNSSRRISSSSSNYSSSPELSTPPPLPYSDLPVFYDETSQDLFDFSHLEPPYLLSDTPPPNLDLSQINPGSNKLGDIPLFDNVFSAFSHNLEDILS